jgi:hypothetical protein
MVMVVVTMSMTVTVVPFGVAKNSHSLVKEIESEESKEYSSLCDEWDPAMKGHQGEGIAYTNKDVPLLLNQNHPHTADRCTSSRLAHERVRYQVQADVS